ncbi:MAG: hypothetical protein L3J30_04200 [Marinosulfonomonas sp.]|nr:hypothetical protein [Marinosulfonomonas sp.]
MGWLAGQRHTGMVRRSCDNRCLRPGINRSRLERIIDTLTAPEVKKINFAALDEKIDRMKKK